MADIVNIYNRHAYLAKLWNFENNGYFLITPRILFKMADIVNICNKKKKKRKSIRNSRNLKATIFFDHTSYSLEFLSCFQCNFECISAQILLFFFSFFLLSSPKRNFSPFYEDNDPLFYVVFLHTHTHSTTLKKRIKILVFFAFSLHFRLAYKIVCYCCCFLLLFLLHFQGNSEFYFIFYLKSLFYL